jgi:hypothetical protein
VRVPRGKELESALLKGGNQGLRGLTTNGMELAVTQSVSRLKNNSA